MNTIFGTKSGNQAKLDKDRNLQYIIFQSFFSGRNIRHYAMLPANFYIFLIFLSFLRSSFCNKISSFVLLVANQISTEMSKTSKIFWPGLCRSLQEKFLTQIMSFIFWFEDIFHILLSKVFLELSLEGSK